MIADDQPFEVERDVGGLPCGDEVAAGDGERGAGVFLVAGKEDGDVGRLERAGGVHGAQRGDDHDVAAFVVGSAGTMRDGAVAGPALERRVEFEHGVEVADQEHPLAVPGVVRDEVTGAARLAHRDPAHREPKRFELAADHGRDGLDPGKVGRAAVLVHQPLEQREGARLLGVDRGDHSCLGCSQI